MSEKSMLQRAIEKFGEPNRRLSTRDELRFGRKGSIRVNIAGPRAGFWHCFETGQSGSLVGRDDGFDYRAHKADFGPPKEPKSAPKFHEFIAQLTGLTEDSPGGKYLLGRGIKRWPFKSVKWLESRQAVAFIVTRQDGAPVAGQLVYVNDDGSRREHFGNRKRTYSAVASWHTYGCFRLPGRGTPIMCEGGETGLSIWQAFEFKRPVYCCLGIHYGTTPVQQSKLIIAADGYEPGSQADEGTKRELEKLALKKKTFDLRIPPIGTDFNDILLSEGEQRIREILHG